MEKQENDNMLDNWRNKREIFKDEDHIPSIPFVLPKDYQNIIIPSIIRCGEETINHFEDDNSYDLFVPIKIKEKL